MDNANVNPKKLFVGNLSYQVTDADLQAAFSQFGELVECKVITDKFTGRSKGFAFVEYTTEEAALAAVEGMNGKDLNGRSASVTIARPPAPRPAFGGGHGGGSSSGGYGNNRGGNGGSRRY